MSLSPNQSLTRFSLAVFNRAPDLSTLKYWIAQLDADHSLQMLTAELWISAGAQQQYPDTASHQEFIVAAYKNIFNIVPDAAGEAYWVGKLADGESRNSLIVELVQAGLGTPDGTPGKAYIATRVEAAEYAVTSQLNANHEVAPGVLADIMATVTEDPATLAAANTRIDVINIYPTSANQEAVCRIYLALFNRAPELDGLMFWSAKLDAGVSVIDLITQIYDLPSVQALFPAERTNEEFIRQAYKDLFDLNAPSDSEVNYWIGSLETHSRASVRLIMVDAGCDVPDGTPGKALVANRSELAMHTAAVQLLEGRSFSVDQLKDSMADVTSDRNVLQSVIARLDNTPFELRPNELIVCRIYQALLGRAPELEELKHWTTKLNDGASADATANDIYADELAFHSTIADDRDFVVQAYEDLFDRKIPDAEGVDYWVSQIATHSRASVKVAMVSAGLTVADGVEGKALVTNRSEAAEYAAAAQLFEGRSLTADQLNLLMSQINDDSMTVALANATVDTALDDPASELNDDNVVTVLIGQTSEILAVA